MRCDGEPSKVACRVAAERQDGTWKDETFWGSREAREGEAPAEPRSGSAAASVRRKPDGRSRQAGWKDTRLGFRPNQVQRCSTSGLTPTARQSQALGVGGQGCRRAANHAIAVQSEQNRRGLAAGESSRWNDSVRVLVRVMRAVRACWAGGQHERTTAPERQLSPGQGLRPC